MPIATPRPRVQPRASYAGDPALNFAQSSIAEDLGIARAQADERRKMLLLDYGDPRLASTFYGGDTGYVGSVRANPQSALSRLALNYERTQKGFNDEASANNLWYGGFRAKSLSDMARDLGTQQYDLSQGTNRALMEINDFILAAEKDARDRKIAAELDAYNRALQSQVPGMGG